jgi:hypothetical protein
MVKQGTVRTIVGLGNYTQSPPTSDSAQDAGCSCNWIAYCHKKTPKQTHAQEQRTFTAQMLTPLDHASFSYRSNQEMYAYPGVSEFLESDNAFLHKLLARIKQTLFTAFTVNGVRYVHCGIAPSDVATRRAVLRSARKYDIPEDLVRARLETLFSETSASDSTHELSQVMTPLTPAPTMQGTNVVRTYLQHQLAPQFDAQGKPIKTPIIITHTAPLFFARMEQEDIAQKQEFEHLIQI